MSFRRFPFTDRLRRAVLRWLVLGWFAVSVAPVAWPYVLENTQK